MPGQGPSCPAPGGWSVRLDSGRVLHTHGPDRIAPDTAAWGETYPSKMPTCSDGSAQHVLLVYARPSDRADRYDSLKASLRSMVNLTNGALWREASVFNETMHYKFRCDAGSLVTVARENMPFANADADFSRIASVLDSRGYNSSVAKYLVFYDGPGKNGVTGQGNVHADDRLVESNANNGGGDFAVVYGYLGQDGAFLAMHELGHNLGAVQNSAPNSSGGYHCNDGRDTMCYDDGGPKSAYTSGVCTAREVYDCNYDDYFNPRPPPGSYLATHWNVGGRLNAYFAFGPRPNEAPVVSSFACGAHTGTAVPTSSCSLSATDADTLYGQRGGLTLYLDWGDGSPVERIDDVSSGGYVGRTHQWASSGTYRVRGWAVDDGEPPLASEVREVLHAAGCSFVASNRLLVGLGGVETAVSARTHAVPCPGQSYRLTTADPNDVDVCWYAGETELSCDRNGPDETGVVPQGATHARVILMVGVNAAYNFVVAPVAQP